MSHWDRPLGLAQSEPIPYYHINGHAATSQNRSQPARHSRKPMADVNCLLYDVFPCNTLPLSPALSSNGRPSVAASISYALILTLRPSTSSNILPPSHDHFILQIYTFFFPYQFRGLKS